MNTAHPSLYFHVDFDAFYASVEQSDNPEYRGKPVIVGARPGTRGVVAACSYEARVFGIRSAMPIGEAFRKCPQGIFLTPRMKRYLDVSNTIMEMFSNFTPSWLQISIDEASLDMGGTEAIYPSFHEAALLLKRRVLDASGLTLSIGIAGNRYLAKLASEYRKPDGLYQVLPGEELALIDKIGLKKLWGIGPKTLKRLNELGWNNPEQIRLLPLSVLQSRIGKALGEYLYKIVRGIDPGIYSRETKSHSLSQETTFPIDTGDREVLKRTLLELSHQVMIRLYQENSSSRTIAVKVRYPDFTMRTFRQTFSNIILSAEELFHRGWKLFQENHPFGIEVRLIGIGFENIEPSARPQQKELFPNDQEKQRTVEKVVLQLSQKNPSVCIKKASLLKRDESIF